MSDEANGSQVVEYVVNPHVDVHTRIAVRRRGRPVSHVRLKLPQDGPLLAWLLAQQADEAPVPPSPDVIRAAVARGLVILESELPNESTPYRCDLDLSAASHVPAQLLRDAQELLGQRDRLRVNPDVHLQSGTERPTKVTPPAIDRGLWQHLPGIQPPIHEGLAPDRPILWVEQPRTGLLQPFWSGGRLDVDRVARLVATEDVSDIPEDDLLTLLLAEIVVPHGTRRERFSLDGQSVIALGRVLAPLQIGAARRHIRALREAGHFETDWEQVPGKRDGIYCEALSMFIQQALAPVVSPIIRQEALPSYTWVFRYREGSELLRHTDRPQCRWNVSFFLDVENAPEERPDWPLRFQVGGRVHAVDLTPGEAVLYSGTDTPHWRDPLPESRAATLILFHYVEPGFKGSRR